MNVVALLACQVCQVQEIRHTKDSIQWRANFVADRCHELGLGATYCLRLFAATPGRSARRKAGKQLLIRAPEKKQQ